MPGKNVVDKTGAEESKFPTLQIAADLQRAYDYFNEHLFNGDLPPCVITLQRMHATYGYFSRGSFVHHDGKRYSHEIALHPGYFLTRSLRATMSTLAHEMTHLWEAEFGDIHQKRMYRYHSVRWAARMKSIGLQPTVTGDLKPVNGRPPRETGDRVSHVIVDGGLFDRACKRLLEEDLFIIHWIDRHPAAPPLGMSIPQSYEPPEGSVSSLRASTQGVTAATIISGLQGSASNEPDEGIAKYLQDHPDPRDIPEPSFRALADQIHWPSDQAQGSTRTKYTCPSCKSNVWGKDELVLICGSCKGGPVYAATNEVRPYAAGAIRHAARKAGAAHVAADNVIAKKNVRVKGESHTARKAPERVKADSVIARQHKPSTAAKGVRAIREVSDKTSKSVRANAHPDQTSFSFMVN